MDPESSLLSVNDAAQRLQRSTEQVRRYLREGRLKGQRMGGQWFIQRDALEGFATAAASTQSFVDRLPLASTIKPLDDIIGIGEGPGSNIGTGKPAYRRSALQ